MSQRFNQILLAVIAGCLVFLCARTLVQPATTVHGANTPLQFSADKDRLYFFDPVSQTVYTYPVSGGHAQTALKLSTPGGELKPAPTY